MKLNKFIASGVNGYLKYDLKFYSELTFLIGINGSGKTTALKLILGLISPSYQYLNQIDFKEAELICSSREDECDISIKAVKNRNSGTFSLSLVTKSKNLIKNNIAHFSQEDEDTLEGQDFSLAEQSYREHFETLDVTKAIRELTTPKFLGLDRRIYEGRTIDARARNRRIFIQKRKRRNSDSSAGHSPLDGSLDDAQTLIFEFFRSIASRQPIISEDFKKRIFEASFSYIEDDNLATMPDSTNEIIEKKDKVLNAIKSLDIAYLDHSVNNFFRKLINLVENNAQHKSGANADEVSPEKLKTLRTWFNNHTQLRRIDEIIKYSQNYQAKILELQAPIKKFEQIASTFFAESNKLVTVAADGEIIIKLGDGRKATAFDLSSGEKQIITMIAHLIFEEDQRPSGIFIIDEPEISLHIAWQEIFVDAITAASPKTQFVLATHSPSIIAKVEREQFCEDLNKLNYK